MVSTQVQQTTDLADVITQLTPLAREIDSDGVYAREIMHSLGVAGAFQGLAAGNHGLVETPDLISVADATTSVARICGATAFCCWCQGALTWYVRCSQNEVLRKKYLKKLGKGEILGGTALSNPMKYSVGLEKLRLTAEVDGDNFKINGIIPWVSNVENGSPFAVIFEVPNDKPRMAIVSDEMEGLVIRNNDDFEVMAGTATVSARFSNVVITKDDLLADDADSFLNVIRPGFVLIQAGIGLGLMLAASDVMHKTKRVPDDGLVGGLLTTPDAVQDKYEKLLSRVHEQSTKVANDEKVEVAQTASLRNDIASATIQAATSAQLMAGAPGLRNGHRAARLIREAAFFGVLTPSVRQLNYMLQN